MKYRMKTAYRVSPGYIQTTLVVNILGMMQGSAAVGALWGLVSSMLFSILRSRFPATRFPSPHVQIFTKRNGEAYVDDTTLWMMLMVGSMQILHQKAECQAQTWERLLWTTGGALNLKKCFWYYIEWKWMATGTPAMMTIDETPGQTIQLTQSSNHATPITIKRVEVNAGRCTLRVHLNPQGNGKMEYQYHMDQAQAI